MKKFLVYFSVPALAAAFLVSCSSSEFDGYEKTDNGLHYKFYNKAENSPHPKQDDELHMIFTLKVKSSDSVLTDTRKVQPQDGIVTMLMRPESFKGGIESGLMMMSKGDSASFIISADSFFLRTQGMKQLPPWLKPGDKLVAEIKLTDFIDSKIVAEKRKKQQEEMMKQMQEMEMQSKTDFEKYLADNKIKTKPTASGLYYIEVKKGTGPAVMPGDTVQVFYKGMLLNGNPFDDNTKDPEPIEFPVGVGMLIPAWDEGIPMMKVGGKAKLIVPYQLAYGARGSQPVIPPFANLVFEIEVKGVKSGKGVK